MHVTFESRFHGMPAPIPSDVRCSRPQLLDDDETLLAGEPRSPGRGRHHAVVTDRRIIITWRTDAPDRPRAWLHDSVWFHEVTAWRQGLAHDERPVIVVEHPAHERLEHVPAHRVLWFEWGNAVGPVMHTSTELRFPSRRDPAFLAPSSRDCEEPERPRASRSRNGLPGTRQERLGEGRGVLARWATYRDRWFSR